MICCRIQISGRMLRMNLSLRHIFAKILNVRSLNGQHMVGKVTFVCVQSLSCTCSHTDDQEIKLTEFVSQQSSSSRAFKPLGDNHTDNDSTLMVLYICRRCNPLIYLIIFQRSCSCNQGLSYVGAGEARAPMKAVKSFICGGN